MGALWHPAATRDPTPAQPGLDIAAGGKPKIVLMTAEQLQKPTYQIDGGTPHFTFDTRPNGRLFQHIPLDKGAYRLSNGGPGDPSPNREMGKVIQVVLYGHAKYAHDWSAEQLRRLGVLLSWICMEANVRKVFSWGFVYSSNPNSLTETQFTGSPGILGRQHAPYQGNNTEPGKLNTLLLKTMLGPEGGHPGGTINLGNPTGDVKADAEGLAEEDAGDDDSADATPLVEDVDISSKAFRFNPPLHRHSLPQRVDFGSISGVSMDEYLRESEIGRNWSEGKVGEQAKKFREFRLGRIIQDRTAVGYAAEMKYRHGFRFLYNPTSVSISASRNSSVILDGRSAHNMVMSGINQNFQTIVFELILNRIPDVMLPSISNSDYSPRLYAGQKQQIRERGTHFDLEYLYRICNGAPVLEDRGRTGDIGVIIPANARLILGKAQNFFGFVQSVSYEDVMFSPDMVPIKTKVNISFRRHVDISAQESEAWISRFSSVYGGSSESSSSSSDVGEGADTDISDAGGSTYVGNPEDAPVPGHSVTYCYGVRNSRYSAGYHTGDDYSASAGSPVTATRDGVVVQAGWNSRESAYGNSVTIKSREASGKADFWHLYAHLSTWTVPSGREVKRGQKIGTVGSSGTSTGAHLHYEERTGSAGNYPGRKPIYGANRGNC